MQKQKSEVTDMAFAVAHSAVGESARTAVPLETSFTFLLLLETLYLCDVRHSFWYSVTA